MLRTVNVANLFKTAGSLNGDICARAIHRQIISLTPLASTAGFAIPLNSTRHTIGGCEPHYSHGCQAKFSTLIKAYH